MHIHHRILLERLESFIDSVYHGADKHLLKQLIRLTVRQPLSDTCFICGKRSDWQELPKSKSLFYAAADLACYAVGNAGSIGMTAPYKTVHFLSYQSPTAVARQRIRKHPPALLRGAKRINRRID